VEAEAESVGATSDSRRGADVTYTLFKGARASRNRFLGVLTRRFDDAAPSADQLPYLCAPSRSPHTRPLCG
jgi:hypothetical protein